MTRLILNALLLVLSAAPSLSAAEYHIGSGQTYSTIAAFDWRSLQPGDVVKIHPGTYNNMIWLSRSGTEENPIVVQGEYVAGVEQMPILDGDNMVIPPSYDGHISEYDLGGGKLAQGYGMVFFHWSSTEYGADPQYIQVKNLEIKSTTPEAYTFTNSNGVVQPYPDGSAGVYIKTGQHLLFENLVIHDTGNGLEAQGVDKIIKDVTIRKSNIYNVGRTDARRDKEHGLYNEISGLTVEYCNIGPMRTGMVGSAIKDRGAGTVIRYNQIYSGARVLDLVEPENQSSWNCDKTIYRGPGRMHEEPNFGNTYTYGNTFINRKVDGSPASSYMMHYGYDNCPAISRDGILHFYNNTVIHDRPATEAYASSLFDLAPLGTVNARNNAVVNAGTSLFHMAYHSKSLISGTYNWLGGNYVSRPYQNVRTGYTATWNETVPIIDGNLQSGVITDPVVNDASVPIGSPLISSAVAIPADYISAGYNVDKQYQSPMSYIVRATAYDIGAFESGLGEPPVDPPISTGMTTTPGGGITFGTGGGGSLGVAQ